MAGGEQEATKKKFDTTKVPAEELKMCNSSDQGTTLKKTTFDTTKTPAEELKLCTTEDARRTAGKGGSHGVQGAVSLSAKAGRYPVVLAGVAVLTGIGTAMYYKSLNDHPVQEIIDPAKADKGAATSRDAIPVPDAPADAAAV